MVVHQENLENLAPGGRVLAEVASIRHEGSFLVYAG
jgi:hypothetical protein